MSAENGIQPRKPLRRTGVAKRRVKTIVRDVNGSTGMFRYFYQNGGRDYDQYRLWLQDVSKSTAAPTPSGFLIELGKIKEEPMEVSSNVVGAHPPVESVAPVTQPKALNDWSVPDVGRFIETQFPEKNLARKFIQQKIDGRTLPMLTEDHLMKIFKLKLGPTLHLLALIASIRDAPR